MKKNKFLSALMLALLMLNSCKKSDNKNNGTAVGDNVPSLITESNGWHILRKDSANNAFSINTIPNYFFFANNSIYYSVKEEPTNMTGSFVPYIRKCNLDGSNRMSSTFLNLYTGSPMVFEGSSTEYFFSTDARVRQQEYNTDGSVNGAVKEIMDFSYFAGKCNVAIDVSPSAHCFMGGGTPYTNSYVVNVPNKEVKAFYWASPVASNDIIFRPNSFFDEEYCKANPNHYRAFNASVVRDKAHTYTSNPCDLAVFCLADTAAAVNGSSSIKYANAILMDTIHFGANKFANTVLIATDANNIYVFSANITNLTDIATTASIIIYDKNTFARKQYYPSIPLPSSLTSAQSNFNNVRKMLVVPSKNYLALLATNSLLKFDLSTGSTSDITPKFVAAELIGLSRGIAFGTTTTVSAGMFEKNGRLYTIVTGRASGTIVPCSNIIYYE